MWCRLTSLIGHNVLPLHRAAVSQYMLLCLWLVKVWWWSRSEVFTPVSLLSRGTSPQAVSRDECFYHCKLIVWFSLWIFFSFLTCFHFCFIVITRNSSYCCSTSLPSHFCPFFNSVFEDCYKRKFFKLDFFAMPKQVSKLSLWKHLWQLGDTRLKAVW